MSMTMLERLKKELDNKKELETIFIDVPISENMTAQVECARTLDFERLLELQESKNSKVSDLNAWVVATTAVGIYDEHGARLEDEAGEPILFDKRLGKILGLSPDTSVVDIVKAFFGASVHEASSSSKSALELGKASTEIFELHGGGETPKA